MAIADKVTSITNHLIADYEELENIGAELENVDKNIENIASCLEEVYNNIPKTTDTGTNLSLNTLKGKMNTTLKGDTQQTQYSGINLYNVNDQTSNHWTATSVDSEGFIELNFDNTNGSSTLAKDFWTNVSSLIETSTDYTIIVELKNISATNSSLFVGSYGNGASQFSSSFNTSSFTTTPQAKKLTSASSFTSSVSLLRSYVQVNAGGKFSGKVRISLVKGDVTSNIPSYQPFVGGTASPNPTYPQNIEVVTGTQEVKVSGNEFAEIETQTLNGMTITKTDNGYILNGTASANTTFRATITNATNTNKTICVKCDTTITNANVQIKTRNSSASQLRSISLGNANTWVVSSGTFEDYYCDIYVKSGTTLSNVLVQPMLLEGTFTTSNLGKYQPYNQEQTQIVSLGDIELCKIGNYQDYLYKTSGKQLFNKDDSSLIFNGFLNASTNTLQTNNNARTICLPCEPNTTYTISKVLSQRFLRAETSSDTIQANIEVSNIYGNASLTEQHITTSANAKYILIFYYLSTADTLSEETIRNSIMINYGSTALPYEPYGSDKWYKKEYIGKVVLNGSETGWERNTTTLGYRYRINQWDIKPNANTSTIASMYSNYLIPTSPDRLYNNDNYSISCFSGTSHTIIIACVDSNTDTLEKWKTWLSTHNTTVYYVLDNATDIEITNSSLIEQLDNLEKLKSYNGVTNISSSGNLPIVLGVSALKGE